MPYGYIHDPNDRKKWILDEPAALIVRRLYRGIIAGKSLTQLASELEAEGVLNPSSHWASIGAGMRKSPNQNPTRWTLATISPILKKEEYMGKKILNKTTKESYKAKKRHPNLDGRLVFEGAIPEFMEFTPLLLNEFIEKVIVHEADKSTGKRIQQVDIHLNFIGNTTGITTKN